MKLTDAIARVKAMPSSKWHVHEKVLC